jgi:hypothetical protein
MGIRHFLRKLYVRIRNAIGMPKYTEAHWREFQATIYFTHGGQADWGGQPWGVDFEMFKQLAEQDDVY